MYICVCVVCTCVCVQECVRKGSLINCLLSFRELPSTTRNAGALNFGADEFSQSHHAKPAVSERPEPPPGPTAPVKVLTRAQMKPLYPNSLSTMINNEKGKLILNLQITSLGLLVLTKQAAGRWSRARGAGKGLTTQFSPHFLQG